MLQKRELKTVAAGNAYRVEVDSAGHRWTLDEPAADGGTDAGPTPVEAFLGGLLSCLTISFQFTARRAKVPIERIEGWIAANHWPIAPDLGRYPYPAHEPMAFWGDNAKLMQCLHA